MDSFIESLGPTAPQAADRSSQAASESNAALRQHIQTDDIASSDPRLMEKAVVRGSWLVARGSWLVARGSWLVKTCYYTRIGCDEISQRAAQGSLYRGAGRQRRSERLKVGPYECPDWGYFCGLRPTTSELRLFHESIAVERRI